MPALDVNRDRTMPLPRNYRLIFDILRRDTTGQPLPAGAIFARARNVKPGIGHATVYRALDRLCDLGLVARVHVPGLNAASYEAQRSVEALFRCTRCETTLDISCTLPFDAFKALVHADEGEVDSVAMTLHGTCAACRAAAA